LCHDKVKKTLNLYHFKDAPYYVPIDGKRCLENFEGWFFYNESVLYVREEFIKTKKYGGKAYL